MYYNKYKNKFKEVEFSPKLTWKVINEVFDKNNNKNDDINVIILEDKTIDVNNEPLNIFNNFLNIGNSLASSM